MGTRVPHDPNYTALVGKAVYFFAYYEWAMIYLIEQFKPGFVRRYARGKPMTSGKVRDALQAVLADLATTYAAVSMTDLQACLDEFTKLIKRRNALIHAHPITDHDGAQVLNYQASPDSALPDMKWPAQEVEAAIQAFDSAACATNELLHRLLK